jgi:hypothetical protein
MNDVEELIRQRAYELWEQGQKTNSSASAMDFWLQAEKEIKQGHDAIAAAAPPDTLEQRLD